MFHDLIVIVELADGGTVFEQQAVGIIEVDRAAPFVVDHGRDIDALIGQILTFFFQFLERFAVEGEMIEGLRQSE